MSARKATQKKATQTKAMQKSAKRTSTGGKKSRGFTAEERAAMKERAQELKAEARERDVLAKIAEMPKPDRDMAKRLHEIIKASAPALSPKTWYGMPAYANDDQIVCFFQSADKFKSRYETFSAFVQGFMPNLARPEVDVLEGLTTAILVDQERMGSNPRSTVGTATDANAMLRILFSRLGKPHIGSPQAF